MTNTFDAEHRSRLLGSEKESLAVLILESNPQFAKSLAETFEAEGISATIATSPKDAMEKGKMSGYIAMIVNEAFDWDATTPFWEHMALQLQQSTAAIYLLADRPNSRIIGSFHARVKAVFALPCAPLAIVEDVATYIRDRRVHGEKRKWDRVPFLAELDFTLENGTTISNAIAINLSIGGMFVVLPPGQNPPRRGDRARFNLRILGHAPLAGESIIHWVQEQAAGSGSLRGFGCEFFNPGEETVSYVCDILNGIRTRQISHEHFVTLTAKEVAAHVAKGTGWIENITMHLSEAAAQCELELNCYAPVLFANLVGLGRTLRANTSSNETELSIDVTERNRIAQFKISCKTSEAINMDQMNRMIPTLLMACGGREMLAVHKAGIEFDLGGGARSALFRMPTKSANQL